MKYFLMFVMLIGSVLSSYAAGYNARQEALRSGIEKGLKDNGLSVERRDDGLKFVSDGETYYIEIDPAENNPMYVRLVRYIKFDDKFRREDAMRNLAEYNSTLAVKAYCKEKNLILTSDMLVTDAKQFNYAFDTMLSLMKSAAESIDK